MKRFFDLSIIFLSFPILVGLIVIISFFISIFQNSPIFFKQSRIGFNGKEFFLIKFCTMLHLVDSKGNLLDDKFRLTGIGKFLRKYSLDELPGIYNVLMNQMSVVGPRPFLSEYRHLYSKKHMRRHDVLPGITGWAQVNGRNSISWEEKFELDLWYIDNKSIFLDIKILILTVIKVFKREGIDQGEDLTMEKFKGY